MSVSRGDSRQPFIYIQNGGTIGTPCFWIDRDYGDHHDLIHDEGGKTRHLKLGHYNPVIENRASGFLWVNQQEIEHYPITIGDERLMEHFFQGTPIPNNLTSEIYNKLCKQLIVYRSRINSKTTQSKYFKNKMGLVFIPHTSWILRDAMKTENYIQNPFWWQKRTIWQNFIRFYKK